MDIDTLDQLDEENRLNDLQDYMKDLSFEGSLLDKDLLQEFNQHEEEDLLSSAGNQVFRPHHSAMIDKSFSISHIEQSTMSISQEIKMLNNSRM